LFKERGGIFYEFASQGSQCSAEHWKYITEQKNTKIIPLKTIRSHGNAADLFSITLDELGQNIFVSFDIDSISSQDAPGVSCPANVGLTAQEAVDICFISGASPNVRMMDISEFNPDIESYRTGRLVTLMIYNFAMGYAKRKQALYKTKEAKL